MRYGDVPGLAGGALGLSIDVDQEDQGCALAEIADGVGEVGSVTY